MLPTIDLKEFEDEWSWPTFLGHKTHQNDTFRFHAPIYTILDPVCNAAMQNLIGAITADFMHAQFDPVMHPTMDLDEFQDEWPWSTFDLLFQVAMQNLISMITSDFLPRFTHNLNLGWVPTWMTLTYILPTVPNRNEWKLCQFLHVVNCMPIIIHVSQKC